MSFFGSGKKDATTSGPDVASASRPVTATRRHSKFFFDNTLVVIQIEDLLFNVHKYQLMKSDTFSDMFKIANESNQESGEGSSTENPIVMSGVTASDFEALLTVLYATRFSTYQPDPEASLIIPAFRLANMWNFADLRAYLLPLAENALGDVDKILFAREFNIPQWLAPAHTRLCQRREPLTTDEAIKLGIHSLLFISRVREEFRPAKAGVGELMCGSCLGYTIHGNENCDTCGLYGKHMTVKSIPANGVEEKVKKWVEDGCVLGDAST